MRGKPFGFLWWIGLTFGVMGTMAVQAQSAFPVKTVRVVVPFSAGGGTDLIGRTLAQKLSTVWGQTVLVDNRAGGGTLMGTDLVAKSAPDGHTLLLTANQHTTNPALHAKLPYDTVRDFSGITQIAAAPMVLCVHPLLPARSVVDLIAIAKKQPGQLSYGTSGNGGPQHLAGELFKLMAQVQLIHVPYKGSAPAIIDVMAGQIQLTFGSTFTVLPQIHAGKLRALAVTSAKRSAAMPQLPSLSQSGLTGYEAITWYGVLAPSSTPAPVVVKLNADWVQVIKLPEVGERLAQDGSEAVGSDPASFDAMIKNEIEKARRIVKVSGMRLD